MHQRRHRSQKLALTALLVTRSAALTLPLRRRALPLTRRAAEGGRGLDHLSAALEEGDLVLYQTGQWRVDGVTCGGAALRFLVAAPAFGQQARLSASWAGCWPLGRAERPASLFCGESRGVPALPRLEIAQRCDNHAETVWRFALASSKVLEKMGHRYIHNIT